MWDDKVDLKHFIVRLLQTQALVSPARTVIVRIHIKSQPAHVLTRSGQGVNVIEQRPENAAAAKFLRDIDALNPPKVAVAPVAPFVSDEQLPGYYRGAVLFSFGQKVSSLRRITQQSRDSRLHSRRIQSALLGFPRHAQIEIGDERSIRQFSCSNRNRWSLEEAGALFKTRVQTSQCKTAIAEWRSKWF